MGAEGGDGGGALQAEAEGAADGDPGTAAEGPAAEHPSASSSAGSSAGKDAKSSAGASKRKSLEGTSSSKGKKGKCDSGGSKRSGTGSNQLVPLSIESSMPNEQTNLPVKVGGKQKKKEHVTKIPMVPFDSPAMGTRSKTINPASPAMSTRSKRRLSL